MIKNKVKVVIVDDHPLFLNAIGQVIERIEFIEVVATYNKPEFVIPFIKNNTIDILITDLSMPNIDGLELSQKVKKEFPEVKIVVVSMLNEANKTLNLMEIGVSAYLLKNAPKDEYAKVLKKVYQGETFFSNDLTQKIKESNMQESIHLTPRETEVLALVANELTNHEIAEKLFVSPTTVISHRKRLLQKFNARNTAGLIKRAMEQNFI
ncbi:MAG: response regulator [Flavobacteriales bacterium]